MSVAAIVKNLWVRTVLGLQAPPEADRKTTGTNKFKHAQFAMMALWIVISGGMAVYRTLSIDPVGVDGHKCIFPYYIGKVFISKEDDEKLNAEIHVPGVDPFDRIANGKICDQSSAQAILDLRLHPVASILGSLFPTAILAPIAYWLSGFGLRRYGARMARAKGRFKVCEFCAETIKSEAKVCRYCGRDVATH
ncbi:MAG: hypothetical protein ACREC0_12210 [Methylocella sp.]